jgi:hypothetical protein
VCDDDDQAAHRPGTTHTHTQTNTTQNTTQQKTQHNTTHQQNKTQHQQKGFPDAFHLGTLDALLGALPELQAGVRLHSVMASLCDRLAKCVGGGWWWWC